MKPAIREGGEIRSGWKNPHGCVETSTGWYLHEVLPILFFFLLSGKLLLIMSVMYQKRFRGPFFYGDTYLYGALWSTPTFCWWVLESSCCNNCQIFLYAL